MEESFLRHWKLKRYSIKYHVLSCLFMDWDNKSGHQCSYRNIWGGRFAKKYCERNKIKYTIQKNSKGSYSIYYENIIKSSKEYVCEYLQWDIWTLSKEMEITHRNLLYRLAWLLQYAFHSITHLNK